MKLPSEFFRVSTDVIGLRMFVSHLEEYVKTPGALSTRPTFRLTYIPKDLTTCTHVFVRCDSVKPPLHPTNLAPFHAILRHDKYLVIDRNGQTENVSLKRLEPAFLDSDYTNGDSQNHPILYLICPGALRMATRMPDKHLTSHPALLLVSVERLLNPLA